MLQNNIQGVIKRLKTNETAYSSVKKKDLSYIKLCSTGFRFQDTEC